MSDYPPNATPLAPAPASGGLRVYADAEGNVWGRDPATGMAYLLSSVRAVGGGAGITEAPLDGRLFGRQNANWQMVPGAAPPTGPWIPVPSTPAYTGSSSTIEARLILEGRSVELKGAISGGAEWLSQPRLIAILPMRPSEVRVLAVPSGDPTPSSNPNAVSILVIDAGGSMYMFAALYPGAPTPTVAWFDGVRFPLD